MHLLLRRLGSLENRVRRLRAALFSILLLLVALPSLAFATRTDEVAASKFTLVDDEGKARAYWQARADEDGDPALVMLDRDGREQIELSVTKTEALCVLRDQHGMNRIGMAVADYPHLMLSDEGQKPRMHLTVGKLGGPTILFIHEDGSFPGGIGVEGDGTPWIKPDRWKASLDGGEREQR